MVPHLCIGFVPIMPSAASDQPSASLSGAGVGVGVAVGAAVGVGDGVGVRVGVGVDVPVAAAVDVPADVGVAVRVAVAVGVAVGIGVHGGRQVGGDVGVAVAVAVAVLVGVGVRLQPGHSVGVGLAVRVGVAVAVGVGVGVQVGHGVGVGVGLDPPDTGTQRENSDVSRGKSWAKAVTLLMTVPGTRSIDSVKAAFPWESVMTEGPPIHLLPSVMAGSHGSVSEKRKTRKDVFGVLCSMPFTVRTSGDEPDIEALVRLGKFCRLLGPLSASSGSFGVMPSGARSIPSPPLR